MNISSESVDADVDVGNQNAAAALHCWGRRLVSSVSPAAKIITGSELRLSVAAAVGSFIRPPEYQ